MNRSAMRQSYAAFCGIFVLCLFAAPHSRAEESPSSLSGRVVDEQGQPMDAMFPLAIQQIESLEEVMSREAYRLSIRHARPDSGGGFHIPGIVPGLVHFVVLPKAGTFEPDAEILSIAIGDLTFFPVEGRHQVQIRRTPGPDLWMQPRFEDTEKVAVVGGIPFSIKPGADIKDIQVAVRPRMRLRGRILLVDGTPLSTARGTVSINYRSVDGVDTGTAGSTTWTDADGFFVKYVDFSSLPVFCKVSADYHGERVTVEPFELTEGERRDDLVFRLSGTPQPQAPEPVQEPTPVAPRRDTLGAWAVNPATGHAYQKIPCESWEEARAKAIAAGAHLVSINDAAEQAWLLAILGQSPFWIGLRRLGPQGAWQWADGAPVGYTNWSLRSMEMGRGPDERVFVDVSTGDWHIVGRDSPQSSRIGVAILEKASFLSETRIEDK